MVDTRSRRRWRRYLADEQAEAALYRSLASRRDGEERSILLGLAAAEARHEQHWRDLLGEREGRPRPPGPLTRLLVLLAGRFGSVFTLALIQRAEHRTPYLDEADATPQMAADELLHGEVVRSLAVRGRERMSGTFRAAVFGANDGLVSNLALVLGIGATGVDSRLILATGMAGLLAGALSMAAGEFVSVRSQRELLAASTPDPRSDARVGDLDREHNELRFLFRARGIDAEAARELADDVLAGRRTSPPAPVVEHEAVGGAWRAAASSFCFFAGGALIPVLPYLFGATGPAAVLIAVALVGLALAGTGSIVGLLSGVSPGRRALRQLLIGFGAAGVTYLLGLAFGASTS